MEAGVFDLERNVLIVAASRFNGSSIDLLEVNRGESYKHVQRWNSLQVSVEREKQ